MGLFGGSPGKYFATNAPKHWPNVKVIPLDQFSGMTCQLQFLADYRKLKGPPMELSWSSFMFDEGFLSVSLFVRDGGVRVPVFVYPANEQRFAEHFFWARERLMERGFPGAVYYCSAALPVVPPHPMFTPFTPDLFTRLEGPEVPKGQYNVWWGTVESAANPHEPRIHNITRAFQALDQIESYVWGEFCVALEAIDRLARVPLPEDETTVALFGPDEQVVLLLLSREKGIRFAFRNPPTSEAWCTMFLGHFATYAEQLRREILDKRGRLDDVSEWRPLLWWQALVATSRSDEYRKRVAAFGDLAEGGPNQIWLGGGGTVG